MTKKLAAVCSLSTNSELWNDKILVGRSIVVVVRHWINKHIILSVALATKTEYRM